MKKSGILLLINLVRGLVIQGPQTVFMGHNMGKTMFSTTQGKNAVEGGLWNKSSDSQSFLEKKLTCPAGFELMTYNGVDFCYKGGYVNFDTAEQNCLDNGMRMVEPRTYEVAKGIDDLVMVKGNNYRPWLGLVCPDTSAGNCRYDITGWEWLSNHEKLTTSSEIYATGWETSQKTPLWMQGGEIWSAGWGFNTPNGSSCAHVWYGRGQSVGATGNGGREIGVWALGPDCTGHSMITLCEGAPAVAAVGDPHLTNMDGLKFDIMQAGMFNMITVSENAQSPPDLQLDATVMHVNGTCSALYMDGAMLSGKWLGEHDSQLAVRVQHYVPQEDALQLSINKGPWQQLSSAQTGFNFISKITSSRVQFSIQNITIGMSLGRNARKKCVHDQRCGYNFLNLQIKGVQSLDRNTHLSGLLARDDHVDISKVPAGCRHPKKGNFARIPTSSDTQGQVPEFLSFASAYVM